MTDQTNQNPYPTTITRDVLVDKEAFREILEGFDEHYPEGVLTLENVSAHMVFLTGPMALHEPWLSEVGLLPPLRFAGGDNARITGSDYSTLTGGANSTLTGGDYSTLTGGGGSTLTGGSDSSLTGGAFSTLTGGSCSFLAADAYSALTGGDYSTLVGGYGSTLIGGANSTLTGGHASTLTGGISSLLVGGHNSTLTGGANSTLTWKWYDGTRHRLVTAYVGEDGILPNTAYTCIEDIVILKEVM